MKPLAIARRHRPGPGLRDRFAALAMTAGVGRAVSWFGFCLVQATTEERAEDQAVLARPVGEITGRFGLILDDETALMASDGRAG
jgi:hypothetical protein